MAGRERISVRHRNEELCYLNTTSTFHIFIDRRTGRRYRAFLSLARLGRCHERLCMNGVDFVEHVLLVAGIQL